jgi:hypothetical protein
MLEKVTNFLTHAVTLYTIIIGIVGAIITVFVTYQNFMGAIEKNQKQIEVTQIMILKPLVRYSENNKCPVSDAEWDEYMINASALYELKKKHKLIPSNYPFQPVERITQRTEECKN